MFSPVTVIVPGPPPYAKPTSVYVSFMDKSEGDGAFEDALEGVGVGASEGVLEGVFADAFGDEEEG